MSKTSTRLDDLRHRMHTRGVDLLAIGPGAHMRWLLGFSPHPDERPCLLFITTHSAAFLMPSLNVEDVRNRTATPLFPWTDDDGPDLALAQALQSIDALSAKTVALDETMRADFALLLLGQLPHAAHRFSSDTIGALRMIKDVDEYGELKKNALIADRALNAGLAALRPGMREIELMNVIKEHFATEGAPMLFGIVGSGANGAFPHHETGERIIEIGDVIVIDIGGQKDRYPSDMTRMAVIGSPPKGYDQVHAIVEAAVQAAMTIARPGARACDVDAAARGVIVEAGYGNYFVHRTGHGLGVEIHEPPFISASSQTLLEPGMVFSIEPGIYLPGRFGIRLEDIVILRKDGPEILSGLSRDLVRLDANEARK